MEGLLAAYDVPVDFTDKANIVPLTEYAKTLKTDNEEKIMEMIRASENDFDRLTEFYRDVILHTENMDIYAKWIYGQHPTDEMIMGYIDEGAMYLCENDGAIISAVAVTPYQGEDYHDTEWSVVAADDEVSVVHILCVDPKLQKQGIARKTMELVIQMSRKMGKKAVRLDALSCNTPAHRLYSSSGFEKKGSAAMVCR